MPYCTTHTPAGEALTSPAATDLLARLAAGEALARLQGAAGRQRRRSNPMALGDEDDEEDDVPSIFPNLTGGCTRGTRRGGAAGQRCFLCKGSGRMVSMK